MLELLKLNDAKFKEGNEQDQLYDHQNLVKMIMESLCSKIMKNCKMTTAEHPTNQA